MGDDRLRPLPVQTVALAEAGQAFRRMAQGQHVGKLVLVNEAGEAMRIRAEGVSDQRRARGDRQALAQWLVEQERGI
jgi:hypothetical protein